MKRMVCIAALLCLALACAGCTGSGVAPGQEPDRQSAGSAPASAAAQAEDDAAQQPSAQEDAEQSSQDAQSASAAQDPKKGAEGQKPDYSRGKHHARMKVKGYGTLTIEVRSDVAPVSSEEFCRLVEKKYYDGKKVYWFLNDIYSLIGSGVDKGTGVYTVRGEFEEAGYSSPVFEDALSLKRGTIAFSRTDDGRSSDASALVLFLSDCSYLDGKYAAFARVERGMGVFDKIAEKVNGGDGGGGIDVSKNGEILDEEDCPVIKSVRMVD